MGINYIDSKVIMMRTIYCLLLSLFIFSTVFSCSSADVKDESAGESVDRSVTNPEDENSLLNVTGKGCTQGDCKNGIGTYVYDTGDVYAGSFVNEAREGKGVMTYANGDIYSGNFKNNKRHGYATYTFKNGDKYLGEFFEGEMRGLGNYFWTDGNVLKGDFDENGESGKGIYMNENKDLRDKGRDCLIEGRKVNCFN